MSSKTLIGILLLLGAAGILLLLPLACVVGRAIPAAPGAAGAEIGNGSLIEIALVAAGFLAAGVYFLRAGRGDDAP